MVFSGTAIAKTLFLFGTLRVARSFHLHPKVRSLSSSGLRNTAYFHSSRQKLGKNTMATTSDASVVPKNFMDAATHNFSWQQTMLRIKDPKVSLPFYEDLFGFKLVHFYNFPQWNFSLYFLAFIPDEEKFDLIPGSPESEKYLWSCKGESQIFIIIVRIMHSPPHHHLPYTNDVTQGSHLK
jgi:hypothetical protein